MKQNVAGTTPALTVVTIIFFMWGFLTSLNDVLIPHLKSVFSLNYATIMLVQFTFFGAYFVMSLPSGKIVSRIGYKYSIVLGLIVAGLGALLFLPAARLPSFGLFLAGFFTLASGITLLQVAANPYVSLLGSESQASSRLNLAQAFNSLGTTLAPKLGGMLILSAAVLGAAELAALPESQQAAYRLAQAQMVQLPYLGLGLALFALAAGVFLFRLPPLTESTSLGDENLYTFSKALKHRHLRLGVVAIFVYVGAEVAIGSFLINYIAQPAIGNVSESQASNYVSYYWGGAMIGRFIGALLLKRVDPRRLLAMCAAVAAVLLAVTMSTTGGVAVWSIVSIGLFNSIMFPNIFTLGIERLGPLTGKASSLLIMAIVGGAIVPLLQGVLADRIGVQLAFILPLVCYLYIIYYGLNGSKLNGSLAVAASGPVATAPAIH
ncbi:MAG: sugar MFS transporter [Tahibacter sp.]